MTITGAFEPSSIVTRLIPAVLQMCSPTSRLPVNVILRTRRSATSRSPISPPQPVSVFMPSGRRPASRRISVSRKADSGVSVARLPMTALPPARPGAPPARRERPLDGGALGPRPRVDDAPVVGVAALDLLALVDPLPGHVHLHGNTPLLG